MFRLEFETDNAAFEDGSVAETVRILRAIANRLDNGTLEGNALDSNGNAIGTFELSDVDDGDDDDAA
jgi:hypothetical protein